MALPVRALWKTSGTLGALLAASLLAQEPQAPAQQRPASNTFSFRNFFNIGAPPDPAAVERGQKLYVPSCGFCHGTNATGGNSGPDLVRSVLVLHDEGSGKEIGPVILNGRPDKGMPKFAFTQEQIKDLAAFFLSRSQSAANRMEYKILNVVTGDASAGQSYFASHCANCHSPTGDLARIATRFDPVALQSRFLYPVTRGFPGMPAPPPHPRAQTTVTVTLPSGQTYAGALQYLDDFNVALKDSSGEYRSWSLDGTGVKVAVHDPLQEHLDLLKQYSDADMHNILAYLETLK
ncbi:MAG TPA: c-type cytochrome [Bryobacteraceae bacterium]|nr:c-type cytochrome [Bryobacteraceae bacterium]